MNKILLIYNGASTSYTVLINMLKNYLEIYS